MELRQIDPPFRPRIKEEDDVTNFDKAFTEEKLQDSLTSAYVSSQQFQRLDGFTYDQSPKFEIASEETH